MNKDYVAEADTDDQTLSITKRTVTVGKHVYLTQNICHFGPGQVPNPVIPRGVTYILFFLAVFLSFSGQRGIATVIILLAIVSALWNTWGPKRHGLLMNLNSGEMRFFPTRDKGGLATAVNQVQQIIETVEQSTAEITVNETKVIVSHSTVGTVNTGRIGSMTDNSSSSL